jgi:DNA-binding MarR family transcriptional regulator
MNHNTHELSERGTGLLPHASQLAHLTRELAQCCIAKESEIFGRFQLSTGEGSVLLSVAEGAQSPSALAERLGVARSRITPLVQNLVERGFLQRSESQGDRRVRELRLTKEGERVAQDAEDYRLGFHQRLLEHFGESERKNLFRTLSQLHDRMMEIRKNIKQEK